MKEVFPDVPSGLRRWAAKYVADEVGAFYRNVEEWKKAPKERSKPRFPKLGQEHPVL